MKQIIRAQLHGGRRSGWLSNEHNYDGYNGRRRRYMAFFQDCFSQSWSNDEFMSGNWSSEWSESEAWNFNGFTSFEIDISSYAGSRI